MTKISKAIGKMQCLCCGETITVKQADTGTLSVSCPDCDFSGYGKTGTDSHRLIMRRVVRKAVQDEPEPTPVARAPASKPAPAPAAKPAPVRNTIFG